MSLVDRLNERLYIRGISLSYSEELDEIVRGENRHYMEQILPKALMLLPNDFVQYYNEHYCLCDWSIERLEIDRQFRSIKLFLVHAIDLQEELSEKIVLDFKSVYPFYISRQENSYPCIFEETSINGFKFERVGEEKAIHCSIMLLNGTKISFTFLEMMFTVLCHE